MYKDVVLLAIGVFHLFLFNVLTPTYDNLHICHTKVFNEVQSLRRIDQAHTSHSINYNIIIEILLDSEGENNVH